jgi:hypothetical protein
VNIERYVSEPQRGDREFDRGALREPIGVLHDIDEVVAVAREEPAEFDPDSAGRAGDDCDETGV